MASPPSNYDSPVQSIFIDPVAMHQSSLRLTQVVENIAQCCQNIGNDWAAGRLSWAGGASDAATAVIEPWQAFMIRAFGPIDPNVKPGPEEAVLSKIAAAAMIAAANADIAEDAVIKLFGSFVAGSDPGPSSAARHYVDPPVIELNAAAG